MLLAFEPQIKILLYGQREKEDYPWWIYMVFFFFPSGHRGAGGTNPSTGSSRAGHQVSILCKFLFMSEAPCQTETSTKIHQNIQSLTFALFSIFSFPHPLCRRPPQAYRSWYQARGVRACKRDPHGPVWDRSPGHCGSHGGGGPEIPCGGCYVHRKWGRGGWKCGPMLSDKHSLWYLYLPKCLASAARSNNSVLPSSDSVPCAYLCTISVVCFDCGLNNNNGGRMRTQMFYVRSQLGGWVGGGLCLSVTALLPLNNRIICVHSLSD